MIFTKSNLDKAVYVGNGKTRCIVWDDDVSCFGCRIFPSNKKSYVLFYRYQGAQRLMTLGSYGVLSLQHARDKAKIFTARILEGADPLTERNQTLQAETTGDFCKSYLEKHAKVHKKSWSEDERRINSYILIAWKNRKLQSILRSDVSNMHRNIGIKSIYEANRTLSLISKIFHFATDELAVPNTFPNPAIGVKRFKENKRDRWVRHEELPRLAEAIDSEQNIYVKAALWLYFFTGLRKSELLKAKWVDIDWQRAELRLPDTKGGRVHYVPLSKPAIEVLNRLPRLEGNEYILPGHKKGQPLVNISKPWLRIRKNAQLEDVRLHDIRRTVGSWLVQKGNSLSLIGKVLNHRDIKTTQIYARLGEDQGRIAMEEHGEMILSIVHGNKLLKSV